MRVRAEKSIAVALEGSNGRTAPSFSASRTIERPSGVWSKQLEPSATMANSFTVRPDTGRNSSAKRLPIVIVPVLSRMRVLTSPQASTARPDVAITLNWATRSIPAIPIALSKPPMVVGISATSRATSITTEGPSSRKSATGESVTTLIRNTWVSTASNTVRAISFGVLVRSAPSTRAIMRSMKPLPGSEEMRSVS